MTKSEELVIVLKRIPEQEHYIQELGRELDKWDMQLWKDVQLAISKRKRIKELQISAKGVLYNLYERKRILQQELKELTHGETNNY